MGWVLAIDFGTSSTSAAAGRDGSAQIVPLDGGLPRMLSNVFLQESTGRLLLGDVADNAAVLAPWCLDKTPKRRLGQPSMWLGERQLPVKEVVGEILKHVGSEARRFQGGEPPDVVRLTHPVRWGSERKRALIEAAQEAGLAELELVPEPVAAAIHYAQNQLEPGERVAVYDLGGGTFDTAVLIRANGDFTVVGRPGGSEQLGGEVFDTRLYEYLGKQLPEEQWIQLRSKPDQGQDNVWPQVNREFQRRIRRAKELLSNNPQVDLLVPSPVNQELTLTEEDLNSLIRRDVDQSIQELADTIRSAKLEPSQLSAIYLAGGASQIPLVARLIDERLGITPRHLHDPKAVICLGAATKPHQPKRPEKTIPSAKTTPSRPEAPERRRRGGGAPTGPLDDIGGHQEVRRARAGFWRRFAALKRSRQGGERTAGRRRRVTTPSTPEGRPSGSRAGFWRRFAAVFLDGILLVAVAAILSLPLTHGQLRVDFSVFIVLSLAYFSYFEGSPRGQTLGKRALGIRVVDYNTGDSIGYGRAAIRFVISILSFCVLYIGFLWMLWDREKQTWHDKVVSSIVVPKSDDPVK